MALIKYASHADKYVSVNSIPPYLKRTCFRSSLKLEDFGDGGAFPEIHHLQFPLHMGMPNKNSNPGFHGIIRYDVLVKQNENSKKIVYSNHNDLIPMYVKDSDKEEIKEKQKMIENTSKETKAALEKIVNIRLSAGQEKCSDSKFIKYRPSEQSGSFNSGAKERMIRMVEKAVDPLEPPKFKHKKVPKASGSPPVPVMHSPPRPVTVKDQEDWKIPPCISNWKNPKGYMIPLDKRLTGNGRGLEEVRISDCFAELAEAMYVAEQKAREAVAMRVKVREEMAAKEKEKKSMELLELACKARAENALANASMKSEDRKERLQRDKNREERRRKREEERREEAKYAAMGKKSKIARDGDRDISEKVALGMATTGKGGEVQYDQRLFNQEKGMDSGFATDDAYNVYDRGLFTAQPTMSTLFKPKKDADSEMYGGADEQMEKIVKTDRFKPDKAFTGASKRAAPRDRPVEFENVAEEADPFGLDLFLTEVKKGKKAMDKIGSSGTMKATAGSMRDGNEGSSSRSHIAFSKAR